MHLALAGGNSHEHENSASYASYDFDYFGFWTLNPHELHEQESGQRRTDSTEFLQKKRGCSPCHCPEVYAYFKYATRSVAALYDASASAFVAVLPLCMRSFRRVADTVKACQKFSICLPVTAL
jgi:hypothetical protein